MAKGIKTGGRKPGSKNKMTGAHQDFLSGWDQVGGQPRAVKLLQRAFEEAEGHEVRTEKLDGEGNVIEVTVKREYNFAPLLGIMPYIARKMPEELGVRELPSMDPLEIDRKWGRRQDRSKE